MVVGAVLQCTAFELAHLIVGRIVTGIGNGLNTSTVPTWQSECSKSHRRGQLVMIEGALITGGICISYWLDFGFSFLEPSSVSWRFPIAFQILFAIIILLFVLPLPESPRWLIMKGKEEEAVEVLTALMDLPADDPLIHTEFTEIKDTVLALKDSSFKDLFTMDEDRHFHRVVLAYVNQMFQQISGINLITYYAAVIYENSIGLSGMLSRILAACNGTEYFLASWLPVVIVEKVGRRPLMLVGAAGMSLSMVVLAITTSFEGQTKPGIVAAVFLFVFNTFFAWGWLGMTWLYPAEIVRRTPHCPSQMKYTNYRCAGASAYPCPRQRSVHLRQLGLQFHGRHDYSCGFQLHRIQNLHYLRSYVSSCPSSDVLGEQLLTLMFSSNAFIFPVVYFFYPETAYRSLEEMDNIFHKTTSIWDLVKVARDEPRRYGKNGELLINYAETEDHLRRASHVSGEKGIITNKSHANADYHMENGEAHIEHIKDPDQSA